MGAEFLCLSVSARRQLIAPDTGGKTEVVLYSRAGPGLSSGRAGFEHHYVESFRCRIHGRRQSRRSGADDHSVVHLRLVDRVVEAETIRDIAIARIPQNDLAAADQYGDIGDRDPKSIQKLLNAGVTIEVDVLVRVAVTRQKLLNAKCLLRVSGSDQHDVADAAGDQPGPPQEKRAHEDLAQVGVRLH